MTTHTQTHTQEWTHCPRGPVHCSQKGGWIGPMRTIHMQHKCPVEGGVVVVVDFDIKILLNVMLYLWLQDFRFFCVSFLKSQQRISKCIFIFSKRFH